MQPRLWFLGTILAMANSLGAGDAAPSTAHGSALLAEALRLTDTFWDERAALVWSPTRAAWAYSSQAPERRHLVRESAWYALGLLLRDGPGDRERACRVLAVVLSHQIDEPGAPWDGTFYRNPEEPHPPTGAQRWDDYDPNWRQFIGTTLALVLIHFENRLPDGMAARIERALERAITGEHGENRLRPAYTNIALMHAFLEAYAGRRLGREDWVHQADEWAAAIAAGFQRHGAFEEYNSPTYYGVDLFGLALWREHGPTPRLRELGAGLEAALWRDLARFYHAGMRNFAGPYDRAYGMDLRRYCALVALPIALAVEREIAPLPDAGESMLQAHDFMATPLHVILGVRIPNDVLPHLQSFQGERTVTQHITDRRTATAWLAGHLMIGAEDTNLSRAAGTAHNQFHPATLHWLLPDGTVGWILLQKVSRVNARASANRLEIAAVGDATFRISAPGLALPQLGRDRWQLPGLEVHVETDAHGFTAGIDDHGATLSYHEATRFILTTAHQPQEAQ